MTTQDMLINLAIVLGTGAVLVLYSKAMIWLFERGVYEPDEHEDTDNAKG